MGQVLVVVVVVAGCYFPVKTTAVETLFLSYSTVPLAKSRNPKNGQLMILSISVLLFPTETPQPSAKSGLLMSYCDTNPSGVHQWNCNAQTSYRGGKLQLPEKRPGNQTSDLWEHLVEWYCSLWDRIPRESGNQMIWFIALVNIPMNCIDLPSEYSVYNLIIYICTVHTVHTGMLP